MGGSFLESRRVFVALTNSLSWLKSPSAKPSSAVPESGLESIPVQPHFGVSQERMPAGSLGISGHRKECLRVTLNNCKGWALKHYQFLEGTGARKLLVMNADVLDICKSNHPCHVL